MHCPAVAVLGVLDQEHHEKRDDGGAGIDDELPGIAELEQWPGQRPEHDDRDGHTEGRRVTGGLGRDLGEPVERLRESHAPSSLQQPSTRATLDA